MGDGYHKVWHLELNAVPIGLAMTNYYHLLCNEEEEDSEETETELACVGLVWVEVLKIQLNFM